MGSNRKRLIRQLILGGVAVTLFAFVISDLHLEQETVNMRSISRAIDTMERVCTPDTDSGRVVSFNALSQRRTVKLTPLPRPGISAQQHVRTIIQYASTLSDPGLDAILAMGKPAIPFLHRELLRTVQPPSQVSYTTIYPKLPAWLKQRLNPPSDRTRRAGCLFAALYALGAQDNPSTIATVGQAIVTLEQTPLDPFAEAILSSTENWEEHLWPLVENLLETKQPFKATQACQNSQILLWRGWAQCRQTGDRRQFQRAILLGKPSFRSLFNAFDNHELADQPIQALQALVREPNPRIQLKAMNALMTLEESVEPCVPTLHELARRPDSFVRYRALALLNKIHPNWQDLLETADGDDTPRVPIQIPTNRTAGP